MMRTIIYATKAFNRHQVNFNQALVYLNTYFNESDGYFLNK